MKLKGAQIIVETLIEQGASTVFGYPGGQVIDIYDALYLAQDRIHHIITAHEQGAAHAADGYARATGEVGVVIATSGPGATNLVTGIATAYLDSVPLVAITQSLADPDLSWWISPRMYRTHCMNTPHRHRLQRIRFRQQTRARSKRLRK